VWGGQVNEGSLKEYFATETRLNIPRLDYSNGSCPSLLVEPQRTNILTYSQNFAHASWGAAATTINTSAGISPDGTLNANKFIPNTSATAHYIDKFYISTLSGSISIYAKADGYNNITILTATFNANFNLSNGTISDTGGIGTADIISVGNGWYRCIVYKTLASETIYISCGSNTNAGFFNGSGNGTSGVLIWGAQVEQGAYPTSYIPTQAASVTRNADAISKTGISSLIGQTEGTIFVDANISIRDTTRFLVDMQDGTNNDVFQFVLGGNTLTISIFDGGTLQAILNGGYCLGNKKIALGYKANDFVLYIDGVQVATDTSGSVPTASLIALGYLYIASGYELGDRINTTALWQTRLTNEQLAQLTTI
jgi:hypothetical protein